MFGLKIKGSVKSYKTIENFLTRYCADIVHRDIRYLVPDDPEYIMKMSPAAKYKYGRDEARDCDDAVRIFRGWLSRKKYGNVLAMDVKIFDAKIGYHAVIGFWYDNKLILGEPQTGALDVNKNCVIKRIVL